MCSGRKDPIEVFSCTSSGDMAARAAGIMEKAANESVARRGTFTLVLSGGSTPKILFRELAEHPEGFPWIRTSIFWGDERCVPLDDPKSNASAAFDLLLSRVPIKNENIFPVPTGLSSNRAAAAAYEETIRTFFSDRNPSVDQEPGTGEKTGGLPYPAFDVILLGVGDDGHTASLYPGNPTEEDGRFFIPVTAPDYAPVKNRVSITLPLINAARMVIFLVSGESKSEVLKRLLNPAELEPSFPARLVRPRGRLILITDIDPLP